MKRIYYSALICAVLAVPVLQGCGRKGNSSSGPSRGKIESSFYTASSESGMPVRMIMAVAYLESGLRGESQSATYLTGNQSEERSIGLSESAFGFSLGELTLALGEGGKTPTTLDEQIVAYGKFMKQRLKDSGLPANAVTTEEKLRWIWKLAEIHRGKERQNRNLWSLFAQEMMQILNAGFTISDPGLDEKIILEKEPVAMTVEQFPANYRQDMTLDTYRADIRPAYLFSLKSPSPSDVMNYPKRIEVVHCPLTLSACLSLQTKDSSQYAPLGAHYVIPSNSQIGPGILQMSRHDESIELVTTSGTTERVTDRIVIMLTGFSGRYVRGIRSYANPMWLNDYQLRLLGAAVNEICGSLERSQRVNFSKCMTPDSPEGITFRTQPVGTYRWGDISEFDEGVFYPYLSSVEGILSTTALEVEGGNSVVEAGANFRINVKFQPTARRVELERLVRCDGEDKRVVWESVDNKPVRNVSNRVIDMNWYDAGPNYNGEQFFRAKVTGENGKFLGWAIQQVNLKNFGKDGQGEGISKACFRN